MASELVENLSKQLSDAQSKYTYFLLAIAASAIAFAIQRTTGRNLTWGMIPLGLAVICWAFSFFSGCRNRAYFSSTLYANLALLQIQNGTIPTNPLFPLEAINAAEGIKKAAKDNSSMANLWGHLQFRLLVAGAVFFLAWHVIEMMYAK